MSQNVAPQLDKELLKQTIATVKEGGDSWAAMAKLEAGGEPLMVAEHYSQLVRICCFQEKNLPLMIMLGRGGIQYCLREAARVEKEDPKTAEKLRGQAKTIAYNLGANCWPGWGDEGIVIGTSDIAVGYDAALLNLRLGRELKRNAEVMGNAHWLVGAHQLAMGKKKEALKAFEESAQQFAEAEKTDFELMAKGYAALAVKLSDEAAADADAKLQAALKALNERDNDDAKFFAEQIETASKIFAKP